VRTDGGAHDRVLTGYRTRVDARPSRQSPSISRPLHDAARRGEGLS